MPKLPRLSARDVISTLERMGFQQVRQKGSHVVLRSNGVGCVVPLHRELAVGTLAGILKQAKLDPEEFLQKLKE